MSYPSGLVPESVGPIALRDLGREIRRTNQGLRAANPSVLGLFPPLSVMISPPTITPGSAGGASAIANVQTIDKANTALRYFGTRIGVGTVYPDTLSYSPGNIFSPTDESKTLHSYGSWGVEFEHYGRYIELNIKGTDARYRLTVLGQGADALNGREDTAADGNTYRILYDFGSVGWRRLRWDFDGNVRLYSFGVGANDTVLAPTWDRGPRVVAIGDSFTEPTGPNSGFQGWVNAMADARGWHDVVPSGSGGTGYLQTNGTRKKFRDRAQRDVINANPDIVVVAGGINDYSGFSASAILDEARLLFAMIRSGLPNAKLIVLGPWWPSGSPVAGVIQARDSIRTAALELSHLFIDTIGGPVPYSGNTANYVNTGWMTGTGKVGATTGSGNADLFTSSDGTHPNQPGHDHLGRRVAAAIAAAMPL